MTARCRRSLFWAAPLLMALVIAWGAEPRAAAAGAELRSADEACAEAAVAAGGEDLDLAAMLAGDEQGPASSSPAAPAEPAKAAGRACTTNTKCPAKQFCEKPDGHCTGKGQCAERPRICPEFCRLVCGCDGKDYCNDCFAHAVGVNIKSSSACKQGTAVACKTNADCPKGNYFCAKPVGQCDGTGSCVQRPTICPDVVDPVCGCDGKTYGNTCLAYRAGVDVKQKGKCP